MISAILISGILQGIFLIFLLYNKGLNKVPNRILSVLIAVLIGHLSLIYLDVKDLFLQFPHLSRLSWLLPVLYGPLLLILTQSVVDIDFSFKPRHLAYLVPFAIYLILLLPYFTASASYKLDILTDPVRLAQADFGWMNHLTTYLHIAFVTAALLFFYQSKKKRVLFFSDDTHVHVRWLETFLWLVLGVLVFSLFTFYARKYQLPYFSGIYPSHFILVVLLIYWIAYKMIQGKTEWQVEVVPATELQDEDQIAKPVKYSKSGLSDEATKTIAVQLRDFMSAEKPYLDPDLNITELSVLINLPRHQLSQVINSAFNCNFFEFVNQYRLQEFKREAVNPANNHLSLLGIALECGFNSKATFNQVFKKYEGTTPSGYIRKYKSESPVN
ncbi:AraC family transcriptional regulator [Dyadobacter flavalbus]|uniref:AraC family transcriptional regulator n=1 Tax=Dyadobacter flavalbus TaxID=2579942 RepID=A0A5M8QLT3_9BACT|nr:helix-turn-helix domain-containing protein [Dyadobacter flavalbus]KAA6437039.1 AraC family transcriptional regulator [Dyadobacter flavalbus]